MLIERIGFCYECGVLNGEALNTRMSVTGFDGKSSYDPA
jgi:hypothetical protein